MLFDRDAAGVTGLNVRVGERPGAGARASFTAPGVALGLERRADRFRLTADLGGSLQLDVMLDTREAPEPFSLVASLPEGGLRAAQLTGPLPLEGKLRCAAGRCRSTAAWRCWSTAPGSSRARWAGAR